MNLSVEKQDIIHKNINLSMTVKNKDNTVPFNLQLDKSRKNKVSETITEAQLDNNQVKEEKQITDINLKTQEYDTEKTKKYKKAEEDSKRDTEFWDKYVGVQLEGEGMPTKVDNNIKDTATQLQNTEERFEEKEVSEMVVASLKDADAMIYHIYASALSKNRELNNEEKQQIADINSGKIRLISQMVQPVRRSLEYSEDPIIKKNPDGTVAVYESNGNQIDSFKSCEEAKLNYPEAETEEKRKMAQVMPGDEFDDYDDKEEEYSPPPQIDRYRAIIPIDVWVESTGNPQQDQERVYELLKKMMQEGMGQIQHEEGFNGWNELLALSDVEKYNDIIKKDPFFGRF